MCKTAICTIFLIGLAACLIVRTSEPISASLRSADDTYVQLSYGQIFKSEPTKEYCAKVLRSKIYGEIPKQLTKNLNSENFGPSVQNAHTKGFKMAAVTETGSWLWTSDFKDGGYKIDLGLARGILDIIDKDSPSPSLYDFGAGKGLYTCYLKFSSEAIVASAFDGAPNAEELTSGNVLHLDLTTDIYMKPVEWVISLEVGEHIPQRFEDIFVNNIARHAKAGIIISWDQPEGGGETGACGGHGHVNCRSEAYIIAKFYSRGFAVSVDLSARLRLAVNKYRWYSDNLLLFRRIDSFT